jgi:hypothetical protein
MDSKGKKWIESDIRYLRAHSSTMDTKKIAVKLGRTVNAIYNKASEKNISLKPKDKS